MKSYQLVRCLALFLILVLNPVYAQDFNAGVDAYLDGDYEKAFEVWNPLATGGDAVAMFNIGVLYSQGLGVPEDLEQGVNWYRQSAIKGYAPAQFNLGVAFREGKGIRKSPEKASQWFRAAAEQDHRHAQYNLASLYWIGDGVDKDRKKAIKWFEKAAKSGDPRAKQILARINDAPVAEEPSAKEPPITEPGDDGKQAVAENSTTPEDETVTDGSSTDSGASSDTSESAKEPAAKPEEKEIVADSSAKQDDKSAKESIETKLAPVEKNEMTAADDNATSQTESEIESQIEGNTDLAKNSAWIAKQPKDNYTIQVFADQGSTKGSSSFIKSNKLKQANRFVAGGWNKIVVGTYPSREAAKQAVSQLPESVQKQQPWIRLFADIQREMDNVDEQALSEKASDVEQKLFAATDEAMSKANIVNDDLKESDVKEEAATETTPESTATQAQEQTKVAAVKEPKEAEVKTKMQIDQGDDTPSAVGDDLKNSDAPLDVSEMTIRRRLDIAHDAFIEQDFLNAHRMWEPLAYAGYAEAQYGLAYLLETGSGISRSEQDAFEWYRLAAEQGHSQAQFNLGLFYMEGRGVMNNEGLGLYWIQTAADNKEQRARDYLVSHRGNSSKEE